MKKFILICALAGFALRAEAANPLAATYTFIGSGNWTTAANWDNARIPPTALTSGEEIVIAGSGPSIMNQNETIVAGSTLTINSALTVPSTNTLSLAGSLNINNTFTWNASGTVNLNAANTETLGGTGAFNINATTISVGRNVTMTGSGSMNFASVGNTTFYNSSVASVVNGALTVNANPTGTGIFFPGISLSTATIRTSGSGAISLTGKAAPSTSGSYYGINASGTNVIESTATSGGGGITLSGTGNSSPSSFTIGTYIATGTTVSSASGAINISGTAGTGNVAGNTYGLYILAPLIQATGSASITLTGIAGNVTGATPAQNYGLNLATSSSTPVIKSFNGNITLNGTGGTNGTTTIGVSLANSTVIQATGTGSIIINGAGGAGSTSSYGINFQTSGEVKVASGNITLNGTAGTSGTDRIGVRFNSAGAGRITSGGNGTITINGSGADVGFSANSSSCTVGGPSATGNIIINANTVDLPTVQSTGSLTIKPIDPATTIGLGTGAAILSLNATELARINSAVSAIVIGDATAGTGAVTINGATISNSVQVHGGSINVTGFTGASSKSQLFSAHTGDITDGGDALTDIKGGIVTLNAPLGSIGASGDDISVVSYVFSSNSAPTGSQFLSSAGTMTIYSIGSANATVATGNINLVSGNFTIASTVMNKGTLTNNANLTVNFALNNGSSSIAGNLVNNGTLNISSGSTLNNGPASGSTGSVTNNGTLAVNGTLNNQATGTFTNNGTLKGSGTITQSGTFTNATGSHIAPGNSPGQLSVTGNFNLGSATLDIELAGTTAGTNYDVLAISGTATISNANVIVTQDPAYTPVTGDQQTYLTAGTLDGVFAAATYPANFYNFNSAASRGVQYSIVPLAIKLGKFTAQATSNGSNMLNWNTLTETKGYTFEISRSTDGKEFATIGNVDGNGAASAYHFNDAHPYSTATYYRLKISDASGETTYSNIALVRSTGDKAGSVVISPVPARNQVTVSCASASLQGSAATITDIRGAIISRFTISEVNMINITAWAAGIYTLHLADGTAVKLVKE